MRQLHTREQSGSNLERLGHADRAALQQAAYRLHIGADLADIVPATRQPRAIEPNDLSDTELAATIELLSAQHERMETEAREGLAEAQRSHISEKAAFQPKLAALIAHVERVAVELTGSQVRIDLADAIKSMHVAAEKLQADYFNARALSDVYPRAPVSLGLALDGLRAEQRQRAAGKQAEVEKLRAQLAALGFGA